jgi:hypothetical protein
MLVVMHAMIAIMMLMIVSFDIASVIMVVRMTMGMFMAMRRF